MTDPKFTTRDELGRHYLHPVTGEKLIGVSTLKDWAISKPFLADWKGRTVAQAAVARIESGEFSLDTILDGDRLQSELEAAPFEVGKAASHDGSFLHSWAENFHQDTALELPGQPDPRYPLADLSRVRQMCEHYRDIVERWQIEVLLQERTVFHSELGYAGSFDAIARSPFLDGHQWCVWDRKTTNGVKPRADITYQLCLYAHADGMWDDSGAVTVKPDVSLDRGFVIKVKAKGGGIHKVEYRSAKYDVDMWQQCVQAVEHYRWVQFGDRLVSVALRHPDAPKLKDTTRRLQAAQSLDQLEAAYWWAVTEDVWDSDTHLELAQKRRLDLS